MPKTNNAIEIKPFIEHRVKTGESLSSLAETHGCSWQQIAMYNFGTAAPDEVNRFLYDIVGCTKRTKDRKNYIFTDADVPGIIYILKTPTPLSLSTGQTHRVVVKRPILYSRVEVQTVDEFGHRAGNVELILRSLAGLPDVSLKSDGMGYAKVDKIRVGGYVVLLGTGKPTWMFDPTKAGPDGDADKLVEAHLDTRNQRRSITRVVVSREASKEWRTQNELLARIYKRTSTSATLEGRGQETSGKTRRSFWYCADNLALAAGWTNDQEFNQEDLVATVLRGFLRDYHPTALARGYYVMMLSPATRVLLVINSEGKVEGQFELAEGLKTEGLLGAYAMFEDVNGNAFVDMASMSTIVSVPGHEDGVEIDLIVTDPQGLHEILDKHAGKVQILYYAPSAGQLVQLGLLGGTGRLEDYGQDQAVNQSIHKRNLAVCNSIRVAYDAYLNQYVRDVEKTTSEDELRKLGPPRTPYEMPTPAGSTEDQMIDIFHAYHTNELAAWHAIAIHLDRFANRLSQGYPFLRIKPKFVAKPKEVNKVKNYLRPGLPDISEKMPVEVEFEMNIDIQLVDGEFEVVTKGDVLIKGKVKLDDAVKKVTGKGVPVEVAFKQSGGNPDKLVASVRVGKFQIEIDTVGKTKLALEVSPGIWVDAEENIHTGVFGAGLTLKGKDFMGANFAAKMKTNAYLGKWAKYIENMEMQVQIGFVGTEEETILAVLSLAPGFFERRKLEELFSRNIQWVDLTLDEHNALVALGWFAAIWDGKFFKENEDKLPESVDKTRDELTAAERIAIVHLGFCAYEDYKKVFANSVQKFSDYTY